MEALRALDHHGLLPFADLQLAVATILKRSLVLERVKEALLLLDSELVQLRGIEVTAAT